MGKQQMCKEQDVIVRPSHFNFLANLFLFSADSFTELNWFFSQKIGSNFCSKNYLVKNHTQFEQKIFVLLYSNNFIKVNVFLNIDVL